MKWESWLLEATGPCQLNLYNTEGELWLNDQITDHLMYDTDWMTNSGLEPEHCLSNGLKIWYCQYIIHASPCPLFSLKMASYPTRLFLEIFFTFYRTSFSSSTLNFYEVNFFFMTVSKMHCKTRHCTPCFHSVGKLIIWKLLTTH